jgi:hypothetical protein
LLQLQVEEELVEVEVQEQSMMQMQTFRLGLTIYGGSRSNRVPY